MAESIYPFVFVREAEEKALPVAREIKWDFDKDLPVFRGGEPVWCERAEAVAVWAWNALHTARWLWPMFLPYYGNEIETLIGQAWSDDVKRAEVRRMIEECLFVSPYIKELRDMEITFRDSLLTAAFVLVSVYGTVSMEVNLDYV